MNEARRSKLELCADLIPSGTEASMYVGEGNLFVPEGSNVF